MTDALALHGPVGEYARAAAARDFAAMERIALAIIAADEIVLPHPEKPEVLCRCRSSRVENMQNLLFFADDNGATRWCLVQQAAFIRIVWTEDRAYTLTGPDDATREKTIGRLNAGEFDSFWQHNDQYGGLGVSSNRPYHFFYDQFIHLPSILAALPPTQRTVHVGAHCFFDPELLDGVTARTMKQGKYYLMPSQEAWGTAHILARARPVEQAIAQAIPALPITPRPDFTLWIGITGQKRSWVEQVEGYTEIIARLSEAFPDLFVYIDGMTAPHGREIEVPEDAEVAQAITERVSGLARVESLVGKDYAHKIARCHGVDAFVANGGTGCFVPLRICRKPGVLHSNRNLWTFRGDDYPDTVVFVDPEVVTDIAPQKGQAPQFVSYSIAWQEIHNRLTGVIGRAAGKQVPRVPVPQAHATTSPEFDRALFGKLGRQLGTKETSAIVLRDVATLFEKKGDFATALALMEQARLQNPSGPVIRRKVALYREKLGLPPPTTD